MSSLSLKAVESLVFGVDLDLGDIVVANKEVRYKGATVLSYSANLFIEGKHHINFHSNSLNVNDNGFIICLLSAALTKQGIEGKVFVEDGKLFASNGLWIEQLRTDGVKYSMDFIEGRLALAPSVVEHNRGNSEALIYDYNQYQKFGGLEMFCRSNGLTENQALHSFEVAKKLLEQEPQLSDSFVTEVW